MGEQDKNSRIDELEGLVELDDRLDLTFDPVTGLIAALDTTNVNCPNCHNTECCPAPPTPTPGDGGDIIL